MSDRLTGTELTTKFNCKIIVGELLGSGGQGDVYKVDYNDEPKALKWYKKQALGENPQDFKALLETNIANGAPSKEFLWPTDITLDYDGTFGYIMDLRPDGFYEVSAFMLRKQTFKSFNVIVKACMNIATAFRQLHMAGYSYQDMNDGNFFINPITGDVLICDNDNVAPDGNTTSRILGKPGYMAPEIVMGINKPNKFSDRYSLAVILFILICSQRPLEGKRITQSDCVTPEQQEKIYGSEALFIMDPDDDSNRPDPVIHRNVNIIWPSLPSYMQDIFLKAFSQESLKTPPKRPEEFEWIKLLVRFSCDTIQCSCGNDIFAHDEVFGPCDNSKCKKQPYYTSKIKLKNYSICAVAGTVIYRCQLGITDPAEALDKIGKIRSHPKDPTKIALFSLEEKPWVATTPSGKTKEVKFKENVPTNPGISIKTSDGKSMIEIVGI